MLKKTPVKQIRNILEDQYDAFICFNSFEERCTTIASQLQMNQFLNCIIFTNSDASVVSNSYLDSLVQLCGAQSKVIELDLSSPIKVADRMEETLTYLDGKCELKNVFIDITTFTHETLLILLAIFREKWPQTRIKCGYVNASEYSYDCKESRDKWLSRGIGEIRSVLGYSGILKPSQKVHLIVIVGYEYERAVRIIETIEPDSLSLAYGAATDATTQKNRGANEHYAQLVKQMTTYYDEIPEFIIPCNDPYKACEIIQKQVEKIGSNYNIIIVPMNNKISTIGAALAAFEMPDIQICYAPALIYNYSAYSIVGDECYSFDLSLSHKTN